MRATRSSIAARLLFVAAPLTFVVIVAGAFTRLSDAGLGCPDWPTCYGQIVGVPDAAAALLHSPDAPLDAKKAWIEVAHRYVAGLLGLVVFAAALLSLRSSPPLRAPIVAAVLVLLQAILGMLTVTEKLRPIIVAMHLMGGAFIFSVLVYAATAATLAHSRTSANFAKTAGVFSELYMRQFCIFAAAVLALQIFLGGWVSANYAALSCPDFPRCGGAWLPVAMDWDGFVLGRELHLDSAGAPISAAALATIHWTHRAFAIVAAAVLAIFGALLLRAGMHKIACILWLLLSLQIALGIVNVLSGLPLWSALSHNAVAVLLAATLAIAAAQIFRHADGDAENAHHHV